MEMDPATALEKVNRLISLSEEACGEMDVEEGKELFVSSLDEIVDVLALGFLKSGEETLKDIAEVMRAQFGLLEYDVD